MARFTCDGNLVRIFATTTKGEERLIVAVRDTAERAHNGFKHGPTLYDYGGGRTYIPPYALGCAFTKGRWFDENADDIQSVFRQAGIVPPKARPARFIRRIIASWLQNRPQRTEAPAQTIG